MASEISREMAIREMARRERERRKATPQPEAPAGPAYERGAFSAASEAASDVFGFGDELTAGAFAAGESAVDFLRGKGFNYGDNYRRIYGDLDRMTAGREQAHPVASTVGNVLGDVAAGGTIAKGLTMAGRGVIPAALEGAGYGAATGAGYARQDEKTQGAMMGGLTGAVIGGGMEKVGGAIANRMTRSAANRARQAVQPQSVDDIGKQATQLYETLHRSGAKLPRRQAIRARQNIDMLLRQTEPELAPTAFGLKKVVDRKFGTGDVDVLDWHNLSKIVNEAARDKRLSNTDARFVGLIKDHVDKLRDGPVIGSGTAMKAWKAANDLTLRKKKMEILEEVLDFADLNTGQYTQAEIAHTIAAKFRQLYKNKSQIASFSEAERQIIRDIGKSKTHGAVVNQLRKLAPRGIVSAALGAGVLGQLFPGGMFVVPAIGEAAQRMANRGAVNAAQTFVDDISRGGVPAVQQVRNPLAPFIPGASAAGGGQLPRRIIEPGRLVQGRQSYR